MNITLLSTSITLHQQGGTEVHAETLARLAAARGHNVFLLTTSHPAGLASEKKDGYTVIYLPGTSYTMSRKEAPAWWKASAIWTARLCDEEKIDVVWAENLCGISYAAIPRASRKPLISIVNGLAIRGEIASNFNRVSTAGEFLHFLTRYAAQTLFYFIPWYRAMVRDSDFLVAISRETAEALETEFPGSSAKTKVVFNPLNTNLFKPDAELRRKVRAELGISPEEKVLIMSGVLHKQKGIHLGLEAFSRLAPVFPELRLLVAGDGPELPALRTAAEKLGLAGRVIFRGAVPNQEMPGCYNAADVYLNPTLRHEGLGIVTLEAMACRLPTVVARIGGTVSTVDDGITGYFVPPGDTAAMADRTASILKDPALASAMGAAGRRKAQEEFGEDNIAEYLRISEKLFGGR